MDESVSAGGAVWACLMIGAYMLPTIVATANRNRHGAAICLLNLVLGWTGIGWLIALVWGAMNQPLTAAEIEERGKGRLILLLLIALPLVAWWWVS